MLKAASLSGDEPSPIIGGAGSAATRGRGFSQGRMARPEASPYRWVGDPPLL